MPKNNKFYWLEGVTEKGVNELLSNENSKFIWLRNQRNRRILVAVTALGMLLMSLGTYWKSIKSGLDLSSDAQLVTFAVLATIAVLASLCGYSLLRISVRGIAEAPDELLDERQLKIRNTSYRYSYLIMGYVVMALMLLMLFGPELNFGSSGQNDASYLFISALFTFASLPSMVLAWRERDI